MWWVAARDGSMVIHASMSYVCGVVPGVWPCWVPEFDPEFDPLELEFVELVLGVAGLTFEPHPARHTASASTKMHFMYSLRK